MQPRQTDEYVKLTCYDENHNGYQFTTGLNEEDIDLVSSRGLYFTNMHKYLDFKRASNGSYFYAYWMRSVSIPEDALVCVGLDGQFKTTKIILGERTRAIVPRENYKKAICYDPNLINNSALPYLDEKEANTWIK